MSCPGGSDPILIPGRRAAGVGWGRPPPHLIACLEGTVDETWSRAPLAGGMSGPRDVGGGRTPETTYWSPRSLKPTLVPASGAQAITRLASDASCGAARGPVGVVVTCPRCLTPCGGVGDKEAVEAMPHPSRLGLRAQTADGRTLGRSGAMGPLGARGRIAKPGPAGEGTGGPELGRTGRLGRAWSDPSRR